MAAGGLTCGIVGSIVSLLGRTAMSDARAMWILFEPIHDVTYFDQRARDRFTAAGLRGFWRGYFAGRSAPLGAVEPAPVIAAFYVFAPSMVSRALPDVWSMASPAAVLQARAEGAAEALSGLLGDVPLAHIKESADLLESAVAVLDPAGRVLGAANAAVPTPDDPYARLHQAATTLREHRGDGHVAALVTVGLGPLEVLALRSSMDMSREWLQPARGWTDDEWAAAESRLMARGLLDDAGTVTAAGRELFQSAEDATNAAAESPWRAIGPHAVARVKELLAPMSAACWEVVPAGNPIGLPR
jgi:hypothetical protein